MKSTPKEAFCCVSGGLLVSLILFVAAFFIQPTIITKEGFWIPAGLLPMVLITGIYVNRKEAKSANSDADDEKE